MAFIQDQPQERMITESIGSNGVCTERGLILDEVQERQLELLRHVNGLRGRVFELRQRVLGHDQDLDGPKNDATHEDVPMPASISQITAAQDAISASLYEIDRNLAVLERL